MGVNLCGPACIWNGLPHPCTSKGEYVYVAALRHAMREGNFHRGPVENMVGRPEGQIQKTCPRGACLVEHVVMTGYSSPCKNKDGLHGCMQKVSPGRLAKLYVHHVIFITLIIRFYRLPKK